MLRRRWNKLVVVCSRSASSKAWVRSRSQYWWYRHYDHYRPESVFSLGLAFVPAFGRITPFPVPRPRVKETWTWWLASSNEISSIWGRIRSVRDSGPARCPFLDRPSSRLSSELCVQLQALFHVAINQSLIMMQVPLCRTPAFTDRLLVPSSFIL